MSKQTSTFTQTRWSLNDLYSSAESPEFEAAFNELKTAVSGFEKVRPQLTGDMTTTDFMRLVSRLEEIYRLSSTINGYAGLWFSEDTQNQKAQSLVARIDRLNAEMSNQLLFFSLWWKDLPDDQANRLMEASGDVRYWLEEMRHFKPYTLTEPEEKIINLKDVTGSNAFNLLYDSITNRYTYNLEVEGKQLELTRDALMVYVRHADPQVRERAYKELFRVYGADGPILGQIYQTLARDWHIENIDLRHFASPISARNLVNDIPDEVVDTLLDVARQNVSIFHRFFNLKARILGVEKLRRYDIYAPVAASEKHYEFQAAAEMVLDSFNAFEPQMASLAQRVFAEGHMDSEVRKGKTGGAFCSTIRPDLTPWVLLNFAGQARDIATMAHELGHGIHSMLASDHSIFTQHACLPLAETASTFGEMILVDRLLSEEEDETVRRDVLFRQVDDAYATIIRQIFFAMFERQAHQLIHEGASVDELSSAYFQNLQAQFGDSVELSDEFRWEWVAIPHIYNVPFYVYAYAFGQLLVLALYQQYKTEGASFKPRYLDILRAGGSVTPVKLLQNAGIDIRKAEFWQGGFDILDNMVKRLEGMTAGR
jgi:oligoendopeptidase F